MAGDPACRRPHAGMAAGPSHVAGPGPRPGTRPQSQQTGYSERYTLLVGGRATHTTHDRTHERHQKGIRKRHVRKRVWPQNRADARSQNRRTFGSRRDPGAIVVRAVALAAVGSRMSLVGDDRMCRTWKHRPTRTARSLIAKRTERQSPGTALSQQTGNSTHHVQPRPTPIVPYPRTGRGRLVRCWT